jgi:hypothetical protein
MKWVVTAPRVFHNPARVELPYPIAPALPVLSPLQGFVQPLQDPSGLEVFRCVQPPAKPVVNKIEPFQGSFEK